MMTCYNRKGGRREKETLVMDTFDNYSHINNILCTRTDAHYEMMNVLCVNAVYLCRNQAILGRMWVGLSAARL